MTELPALRIGHVERDAAVNALDTHLAAGRLDAEEYGDRSARASLARTQNELDELFDDLPEPHGRAHLPAPWAPAAQHPARRVDPRRIAVAFFAVLWFGALIATQAIGNTGADHHGSGVPFVIGFWILFMLLGPMRWMRRSRRRHR